MCPEQNDLWFPTIVRPLAISKARTNMAPMEAGGELETCFERISKLSLYSSTVGGTRDVCTIFYLQDFGVCLCEL